VKVSEKNINFADDIENHQPSERISSELVNGYRRNMQKHDEEGKYFPFNYILIGEVPMKDENGEEEAFPVEERFNTQEDAFEWITKELHHPVASVEDIKKWCEELNEADDGFITLHEVE
jgi:hypothetical protein